MTRPTHTRRSFKLLSVLFFPKCTKRNFTLGWCIVGLLGFVSTGLTAGEISQTVLDNTVLGPPTPVQFEPFQEVVNGVTRQLTGVEVRYDGGASMDVIVENYDTTPYGTGDWFYDVYHSVLFSFAAKPGFQDGGPFFFIGGLAIQGITGELSAGDGGGFPFLMGTPGETIVETSTNGIFEANLDVDPSFLSYFIASDAAVGDIEKLDASLGSFTEALLTPPLNPNGFASIDARITELNQAGTLELVYRYDVNGDLNADDQLNADDIDQLYRLIENANPAADVNGDELIDRADVDHYLAETMHSVYGDSDLNGVFDSSDLVAVFQSGEYEDALAVNSSWASGDWNGDREFDSGDMVFAFQVGSYVAGANSTIAAQASIVPEPTFGTQCGAIIAFALISISRARKRYGEWSLVA